MATLAQMRIEAGYFTPEDFAVRAGVSSTTVRNAEKGKPIQLNIAYRFAEALGISRQKVLEIEGLNVKIPRW